MLVYNTMRFGTDVFTASDEETPVIGTRKALLISKEALDASNATSVTSFVFGGDAPSGTKRRIMFKIDNKFYRFVDGTLTEYTDEINVDNVLTNGNKPLTLQNISDLSALVGKSIYPIIALQSCNSDSPSVKIGLNTSNYTETKSKTVTSAQFTLPSPVGVTPKIVAITPDLTCSGDASVTITVRLKQPNGSWSSYMQLADAENLDATAAQFKIVYKVVNVGSDSAKVNSIAVNYLANLENVTGDYSDLFSVIPNFETDLRLCYLVVRHKKLIDSTIEAFANFFVTPKRRERIFIGEGTGDIAQFILGVDGNRDSQIDHSSIRIFVDGVQTSNFDYNTEVSEITINAASGKSILASYDYDCGLEVWHPMDVEFFQQPYFDGSYMTRFSYILPDDADTSIANIRIRFTRPFGSVNNQSLGSATGKTQQIALPHVAVPDSISLNADFSYNQDTRILTFVAAKNTDLKLSYDYFGEQHKIYSWAAGWSAA